MKLVGVCYAIPGMDTVDDHAMLLLHEDGAEGWVVVGEHISSSPEWAKSDIESRVLPEAREVLAREHPGVEIPYEWVGLLTPEQIRSTYPPRKVEQGEVPCG